MVISLDIFQKYLSNKILKTILNPLSNKSENEQTPAKVISVISLKRKSRFQTSAGKTSKTKVKILSCDWWVDRLLSLLSNTEF